MLPTWWVVSRPNESTTESTTTVVVSTRASKTGAQAAKIRRKVDEVVVEYLGGSPALAAEILQNRRIQELLADENPDHVARAFGEAIEAADAAGASSSEVVRFADAVLPHLVEQLVPVCVSKFQGALWSRSSWRTRLRRRRRRRPRLTGSTPSSSAWMRRSRS